VGNDITKSYDKIKKAITDKFRPAYSELLLRQQFHRCTMTKGQSSRDFLQSLWDAIRQTSCKDDAEQLLWVLTNFTTRHTNAEICRAFELKPPTTDAEALQIVNDIESKQRERGATERINAVLQDAGPLQANEVANIDWKRQSGGRGDGRGRGTGARGGQNTGGGGNEGRACGGLAKCRSGHCPAVGATCYECSRVGHLGHMCPDRQARATGSR
jgi:hypothetical protein